MKNFIEWCEAVFVVSSPFILIAIVLTMYSYSQRYVKKIDYAESGIFFTNEIELSKHRVVGKGKGLFGEYESYSRSDRNEFIKVYLK